jgi:hypothetical protein
MENIMSTAPYTQYHTMVYNSHHGVYVETSDSCTLDNIWHFKADHTYEMSEGTLLCSDTPPYIAKGSWILNAEETQLLMEIAGDTIRFGLQLGATNDTLILSSPIPGTNSEKIILVR